MLAPFPPFSFKIWSVHTEAVAPPPAERQGSPAAVRRMWCPACYATVCPACCASPLAACPAGASAVGHGRGLRGREGLSGTDV